MAWVPRPRRPRIPQKDTATGDELTPSEALSQYAQSMIRRWRFIGGFTVITFAAWIIGSPAVLEWWNYTASWLALVIESVVGIGVYQMSRRDAVILREVRVAIYVIEATSVRIRQSAERLEEAVELVYDYQLRSEREQEGG